MRICIIGAGFTGLAASLRLAKLGHNVSVFEKEQQPGGLAIGFKDKGWKWPLEKHYHHLFTSDKHIKNLAKEVNHKILFTRPKTSTFVNGNTYQLDSPTSLLAFPHLSLIEKIRAGITLAYLKFTPLWKPLEKITAANFLKQTMGQSTWKILWEPLFKAKFGKHKESIPASWFWARVKKRSTSLGYPEGGFQQLAENIQHTTEKYGAQFIFGNGGTSIKRTNNSFVVTTNQGGRHLADRVICTLPTPLFCKITKGLPRTYIKKVSNLSSLGALNLVLILKKPFLADGTYWLNINDQGFPFLAIVEHTNFMDKRHYNENHIIYVGNYLPTNHPYMRMTKEELFKVYAPYLRKINRNFELFTLNFELFKAPFAQPIIPLNYSKIIPPLKTPIPNLYLANIQQVYPWDRGTNYAVELGNTVAKLAIDETDY
ncbi:MAG: NAD(P)/FAD-dependent oxidoreductase [Candidatus Blackburnbacteria bacterium]|nr:NAD(P)/FAD-dependent oxidoreductase [Candidatus Blackburnbacteria bacterium]